MENAILVCEHSRACFEALSKPAAPSGSLASGCAAVEAGSSAREAARRFEVSPSAAVKIVRLPRESGGTASARIGGYRWPLLAGHEGLLWELISAKPGIALAEVRDALNGRGGGPVSLTTI
jgi:transposase